MNKGSSDGPAKCNGILERSSGSCLGADEEAGDVVVATRLVGGCDQSRAQLIERRASQQERFDKGSDSSRVRPSEQSRKRSPGSASNSKTSGVTTFLRTQGAGDDVAQRRALRFRLAHAPQADLFLNQRVVDGDLLKVRVTEAVAAAVTDVEQPRAAFLDEKGHKGGSHAAQLLAALGAGEDGLIGGGDGLFCISGERIGSCALGEQPHDFVNG